jgi:8-oxo-dGTP pyrophosphatase MutT (NUDIX family)
MTAPGPCADPHRSWPAIEHATSRRQDRVPFVIDSLVVGSVARVHVEALRAFQRDLQVTDDRVALTAPESARDAALAAINTRLRAQGLIRAWRDETYPLVDPLSQRVLARFERAAARFWGTLTFGAHATGWVAAADGRPARMWVAQRAFDKATDPGAFDNLVGGGVPHGQTPFETLVREGWEEAGLDADVMRRAQPGRVIQLQRDSPEGLQFEQIHAFDLQLQPGEQPLNQDGEVHAFTLHPTPEALALAASALMTTDAALVTLDFALRHRLFDPATHDALSARAAGLWVGAAAGPGAAPP